MLLSQKVAINFIKEEEHVVRLVICFALVVHMKFDCYPHHYNNNNNIKLNIIIIIIMMSEVTRIEFIDIIVLYCLSSQ